MSEQPAPSVSPVKRPFPLIALNVLVLARAIMFGVEWVLSISTMLSTQTSLTIETVASFESLPLLGGALFYLMLGVGLWRLRLWAWRLTIILSGMLIVVDLWAVFSGTVTITQQVGLVLNILVIFYLAQTDVRRLFVDESEEQRSS